MILIQEFGKVTGSINISGFKHYHTPRTGSYLGGTAIYIKHNIPNYAIQNTTFSDLDNTEIIVHFQILILILFLLTLVTLHISQSMTSHNSYHKICAVSSSLITMPIADIETDIEPTAVVDHYVT